MLQNKILLLIVFFFLPGSQAETKAECSATVSCERVEWSGVDMDVLTTCAPFESLANRPCRIISSQQEGAISSDSASQND